MPSDSEEPAEVAASCCAVDNVPSETDEPVAVIGHEVGPPAVIVAANDPDAIEHNVDPLRSAHVANRDCTFPHEPKRSDTSDQCVTVSPRTGIAVPITPEPADVDEPVPVIVNGARAPEPADVEEPVAVIPHTVGPVGAFGNNHVTNKVCALLPTASDAAPVLVMRNEPPSSN